MNDDTQDTVKKIFTVEGLRKRVEKKFDVATPEVSSKIQEAHVEDRAKAYIKRNSLVDVDIIEDEDDLIDAFKKEEDGDSSSSVKVESDSLSNGGEPPRVSEDKVSELLFQIQRDIEDMEREIKDKENNASGVEKEVIVRERELEEAAQKSLEELPKPRV